MCLLWSALPLFDIRYVYHCVCVEVILGFTNSYFSSLCVWACVLGIFLCVWGCRLGYIKTYGVNRFATEIIKRNHFWIVFQSFFFFLFFFVSISSDDDDAGCLDSDSGWILLQWLHPHHVHLYHYVAAVHHDWIPFLYHDTWGNENESSSTGESLKFSLDPHLLPSLTNPPTPPSCNDHKIPI